MNCLEVLLEDDENVSRQGKASGRTPWYASLKSSMSVD
jgi:hypothetical protein